jgi:hypothetical protein
MNLTELQQEVYNITNRPDLVNETLTAIRSATLKIHQSDYFYKDMFETGIAFPAPALVQQIDYRALIPRWRSLKYLRKTDLTGTEQGQFYDIIQPESVLDQYQTSRADVCYVAGAVIQVRSSVDLQYAILGCYLNPDVTVSGFSSWVALDHPFAIINKAAASVFKMIGETEQFTAYTRLAEEAELDVARSNIQAQGY